MIPPNPLVISQSTSSDPWETPPIWLDPELVETSKQLMAKSIPPEPEPAAAEPVISPKDLQIAQLEQEKQQLFQRNVQLLTEATRLRVENQHLHQQLAQLQETSQNWLTRFFKRFGQR